MIGLHGPSMSIPGQLKWVLIDDHSLLRNMAWSNGMKGTKIYNQIVFKAYLKPDTFAKLNALAVERGQPFCQVLRDVIEKGLINTSDRSE
jgi:hypothetical protein